MGLHEADVDTLFGAHDRIRELELDLAVAKKLIKRAESETKRMIDRRVDSMMILSKIYCQLFARYNENHSINTSCQTCEKAKAIMQEEMDKNNPFNL